MRRGRSNPQEPPNPSFQRVPSHPILRFPQMQVIPQAFLDIGLQRFSQSNPMNNSRRIRRPFPLSDPQFNFLNPDFMNIASRKRKREVTPLKEYQCPICRQVFTNPMSAPCSHTFCAACVERTVKLTSKCPVCARNIPKNEFKPCPEMKKVADENRFEFCLTKFLTSRGYEATCEKYDLIIQHFQRNFAEFKYSDEQIREFLELRGERARAANRIQSNLLKGEFLKKFVRKKTESALKLIEECNAASKDYALMRSMSDPTVDTNAIYEEVEKVPSFEMCPKPDLKPSRDMIDPEHAKLLDKHFDSLSESYLKLTETAKNETKPQFGTHMFDGRKRVQVPAGKVDLNQFSSHFDGISKYSTMKNVVTLEYTTEVSNAIVSSIEFDKDGEFFVIAGIANKMKFYDYDYIMKSQKYANPVKVIDNSYRITNVCWNPFVKQFLVNSDYMGNLCLWDASVGKSIVQYREHEKRCWSVQFNNVNPCVMASGSDDTKVKLWDITNAHSVGCIEAKVQVCCVHFHPTNEYQLVFGGSDHSVYLYDTRYLGKPLNVFNGHKKSVSYIKFMDDKHVVSASTDSTLRVWDITKEHQEPAVMTGHVNEKNFVGLATNGEHIVCGSETNEVYTYYKNCKTPICNYDFLAESVDEMHSFGLTKQPPENFHQEFISAVCWKKDTNIVIAANSLGKAHVIQMYPLGYNKS